MEDELFFVGIRDPIEMRKELLTSSKNLIDSLKRYEAYKSVKDEKQQHILELKHVFDELLVLNRKLRGKLPRTPLKAPTIEREERQEKSKAKPVKTSQKPAQNKVDILEEELSRIEEKLGRLE